MTSYSNLSRQTMRFDVASAIATADQMFLRNEISNSGSGFFGIHGQTAKGRKWIDRNVQGAHFGEAWSDDRRMAMIIASAALDAGLVVA